MNTRCKRIAALALTAGFLLSSLSVGAGAAEQTPDVTKNETVYVIADAAGSAQEIIVSDWLQNSAGKATLSDRSDLTDIQVVKGDAVQSGSGEQITWDCGGEDVYYQGRTTKDLPVGVQISYLLDGKSIAPQDLAGKSGALTIRIQYSNHTAQRVTVEDRQETMSVPFLMATGIILDNGCCKNVRIDHGMVENDGDRTILLGIGMPGLGESLQLDSLVKEGQEVPEFPDTVEITADVTDFSMEMSLTVASCGLLEGLALTGSETKAELEAALDSLGDAATELLEGTADLLEGAQSLKDGTSTLKDGSVQLDDGAAELLTGGTQLSSGATQLQSGANDLDQGVQDLNSGILEIQAALETLDSKSAGLTGGSAQIKNALLQIQAGLSGVSGSTQEIQALVDASEQMLAGIDTLVENVSALQQSVSFSGYKAVMAQNGLDVEQLRQSNAAAISSLQAMIDTLNQQIAALQAGTGTQPSAPVEPTPEVSPEPVPEPSPETAEPAPEASEEVPEEPAETPAPAADLLSGGKQDYRLTFLSNSAADAQIAQLQAQVDQLSQILVLLQANNANIDGTEAYLTGVNANLAALLQGTRDLQSSYVQLHAGITALAGKVTGLLTNLSTLTDGVNALVESYTALDAGTQEYTAGVASILAGHRQVVAGSNTLMQGSSSLKSGAADLNTGATNLLAGISSLHDATGSLKSGASELDDGAGTLLEGAQSLQDGMAEFKDEGIDQLLSLYRDNIPVLVRRLEALQALAQDYQIFSGIQPEAAGTVKFLIRTEGIG